LGGSRELQVADEAARLGTGASGIGPGVGRRSRRQTCHVNVQKAPGFWELRENFRYNGDDAPLSSVSELTPTEVLVLRRFLRWRHPFSSTFITEA
jgi:hypothetical protein